MALVAYNRVFVDMSQNSTKVLDLYTDKLYNKVGGNMRTIIWAVGIVLFAKLTGAWGLYISLVVLGLFFGPVLFDFLSEISKPEVDTTYEVDKHGSLVEKKK